MVSMIKELLTSTKDVTGKDIDAVIWQLAEQHKTSIYSWSYIKESSHYENTLDEKRVHASEINF
ncbi:hypothetical protein CW745_06080 [Psychromonas sp. psych-6C06]|nr:hypothetical protein CW745_06080 [Psychromonas sp. psych-6C06]